MMRFEIVAVGAVLLACLTGCGPQGRENAATQRSPENPREQQPGEDNATHYRVNPEKSRFTAHVGVGGLLAAAGHPHTVAIRDFGGEVQLDGGKLESASLQLTIKSESLGEVGKEFDEKDRQKVNQAVHGEALETSKYPEIVFKGAAASVRQTGEGRYEATMKGDLSLHGVTRQISFPVKVRRDNRSLHATGEFTILHGDYHIKRLSAAGGTVKASDEIKLSFELQADAK